MNRTEMQKQMRQEKIAKYMERGLEWCAKQLATQTTATERKITVWSREAENRYIEHERLWMLERANNNMRNILEENGIRTRRLEVTFETRNCEHCKYAIWEGEDYNGCELGELYEEDCEYKTVTMVMGFYTYEIDDGLLSGIQSNFTYEQYKAVRVVDCDTGRIIYKREEDEQQYNNGDASAPD